MATKSFSDYRGYKNKYSRLVELEREEEMRKHLDEIKNLNPKERESRGRAVLNMRGRDQGKGLGGKYIVKFVRVRGGHLPDTEISVGDQVMLSKKNPMDPNNPEATVIEKTNYSISVSFNSKPPGMVYGKGLRVDLYVNDITFQRMLKSIKYFENPDDKKQRLQNILIGKLKPTFNEGSEPVIHNNRLNSSQVSAVKRSLEAEDLFLIHGPPGTGKTTTLIEVIEQHVDRGQKVLATGDSNVAVDNLVDFLTSKNRNVVRAGHPARVTEILRQHTLDFLVENKEKYQRAQSLRAKANKLNEKQKYYPCSSGRWRRGLTNEAVKDLASKGKGSRGIPPKKMKQIAKWIELQEQISAIIEKAKKLEDEAVDELIQKADVVCTTNSTAGSELLENEDFDVVVIDEATQSTEPSCLISMSHGGKVILAGDHKQLPPTILNQEAKENGLEETLFERMIDVHGSHIKEMLNIQYRMNIEIMRFPNTYFYSGGLKAADEVKDHKLESSSKNTSDDLIEKICDFKQGITFVDTQGNFSENTPKGSTSKENPKEAELVKNTVDRILTYGINPENVGVISPYDAQIELLKKKINISGLEIKTVDGFQGREKDAIILSLVRSNDNRDIGFLKDLRRLNVSLTRARKKLIIIGDGNTLGINRIYNELMDYIAENGGYIKISNQSLNL